MPPIVLDEEGRPLEGREVLAAIVESGVAVELRVIEGATAADLAEIDQIMARLSEELGVPGRPPGAGGLTRRLVQRFGLYDLQVIGTLNS